VPLHVFRLPHLRAANLIVVLLYFALFAMFFFITLYMQRVLGYDALGAGAAFLPMTLSVFTGSTLAPRLVARVGVRPVLAAGMLLSTVGLLLFTGVRPSGSYLADVLPGAIPAGLGMGLSLVTATIAATDGVPAAQSGVASGLLNMSRLFGGALGLAVLSTIATGVTDGTASARAGQALTDGFGAAFTVGAAITLAGALLALVLLRHPAAEREPDAELQAA
jgi:predicted MFS family arabinose efflux permease